MEYSPYKRLIRCGPYCERQIQKRSERLQLVKSETPGKEETWGANNLWNIFSLRKHEKRAPQGYGLFCKTGTSLEGRVSVHNILLILFYLSAKVSKRSDGDFFFKYIFIIVFRPGGGREEDLMLLQAKEERLFEAKHSRASSWKDFGTGSQALHGGASPCQTLGRKELAILPRLTKQGPQIKSENHSNCCRNPKGRGIWDRTPAKASAGTL